MRTYIYIYIVKDSIVFLPHFSNVKINYIQHLCVIKIIGIANLSYDFTRFQISLQKSDRARTFIQ